MAVFHSIRKLSSGLFLFSTSGIPEVTHDNLLFVSSKYGMFPESWRNHQDLCWSCISVQIKEIKAFFGGLWLQERIMIISTKSYHTRLHEIQGF